MGSTDTKTSIDKIAAEAVDRMNIAVRLLLQTDERQQCIDEVKAAIVKARKTDAWTIKDLERQRDNFKAYASRAAHASEPLELQQEADTFTGERSLQQPQQRDPKGGAPEASEEE